MSKISYSDYEEFDIDDFYRKEEFDHKKHVSEILAQEMEGFNLVASVNKEDIFDTVIAVNASLTSDVYIQTSSPSSLKPVYSGSMESYLDILVNTVDSFFGLYSVVEHFVKSNLVIDNFYAYALNETLLDMPISEVRQVPGLKVHYLQVDTKNKCVPVDWFIGYDAFAVYSFINLIGYGPTGSKGFLRTILRPFDEAFTVDFAEDFHSVGTKGSGIFAHFKAKFWLMLAILYDLFVLVCLILTTSKTFAHTLSKIQVAQVFTRMIPAGDQVQMQNRRNRRMTRDNTQTQVRNRFLENRYSEQWEHEN